MVINQGDTYTISIDLKDCGYHNVKVVVFDEIRKLYFNGLMWCNDMCEIYVPRDKSGVYAYTMVFDECSIYNLEIGCEELKRKKRETVEVVNPHSSDSHVKISSKTIRGYDGGDTRVCDIGRNGICGVLVKCVEKDTKKMVFSTQTNEHGEWSMIVKPGIYMFVFEKDGYNSIVLERQVH